MASERSADFYLLGEDRLATLATAAPRRALAPGKADIGGRMRVASILRQAGIVTSESPERIAGSTNEVWRAGDYIVRVGFVAGAERLRREARLAALLPYDVQYPKVIASGSESFGEWIVVRHRSGLVLSQEWLRLDDAQRKTAVEDVAMALKAIHDVKLDADQIEELRFPEGDGALALPHQLPARRILELIEVAKSEPYADQGLLRAAAERAEELADVFWDHERYGLVHGDLHFENILMRDGVLVAVLDFEWARVGPREIDIDVLARFCAEPQLHVSGGYPARAEDYKNVFHWMAEAYPELFSHPQLRERLTLCAMALEIPSLLAMPATAPASQLSEHHPVNRLRTLLEKGSHAERLGWDGVPAPDMWATGQH